MRVRPWWSRFVLSRAGHYWPVLLTLILGVVLAVALLSSGPILVDTALDVSLQRTLLDALWGLLVPGGRLLYATCSVLAAENDGVVGRFLGERDDAVENRVLPNNTIRDVMRTKSCGFQVLPGTADLDGFYYACLEKKVS